MDSKKHLLIIDNKNVTEEISFFRYNYETKMYSIKYSRSPKEYTYSKNRVKYSNNPRYLSNDFYYFFLNGRPLENIKEVYEFNIDGKIYYNILCNNDYFGKTYTEEEIQKRNKVSANVIDYMKNISLITSLETEEGKKLLYAQMQKIELRNKDIALGIYLKLSNSIKTYSGNKPLIFPFGCNSSQYKAVEEALNNKMSIIEGPPGTGKTQTILNIIANIIIRGMNCQVASNNNTAIENVEEKLKKYDLDFFVALLGKKKNKELFIEQQSTKVPNLSKYEELNGELIKDKINRISEVVIKVYEYRKELAQLIQIKNELKIEYKYFKNMIKKQKIKILELNKINIDKINIVWKEISELEKFSIFRKLKYSYIYGVGNLKFYKSNKNTIIKSLQNLEYKYIIKEYGNKIEELKEYIENNKEKEEQYIELSMLYFKKYLSFKYKEERKKYSSSEIRKESNKFINDYPVVLSTTYSSRNVFNDSFKFNYIIMDEASQIDVATGTLALSSAENAVIIGDEKQLPNVVTQEIEEKANQLFKEYNLSECYNYSTNSFLSSAKKCNNNIPMTMLLEHYRCHPKIIGFCNKKFYDNKLVIMTNDKDEDNVINVIKTNTGNHTRERTSQRQVDIIKTIVPNLDTDIGIIAPYNNQVDLIKKEIKGVEVSTVHKFQGREKDTIIISTVDDNISEFVGDPKILNVAISRAKKQLYFIVTGNEIKNNNIKDFIDYVEYNNFEIINSKIYSSFDLLYKKNELERLKFFKKHNRITNFDSENIIYYLIIKILKNYDNLGFHFHQSLNDLINDKSLLNEKELKYVSNPNTHLDFYIFKKIGDKPIMVIEVDGYKYHKEGTRQHERDLLKDCILEKYNIPIIRLKTNGSEEEKKIRQKLDEIVK